MAAKRVFFDNDKWWRVTELEELFFYTLYQFKAYWVVGDISYRVNRRIKAQIRVLNENFEGYKFVIRSNELVHFYSSHFGSNEKRKKSRSICFSDIKQVFSVIENFTFVNEGNKDATLLFERINGKEKWQLAVEIDYKRKILYGKSFRINLI